MNLQAVPDIDAPAELARQRWSIANGIVMRLERSTNGLVRHVLDRVAPVDMPHPFDRILAAIERVDAAGLPPDVLAIKTDLRATGELEVVGENVVDLLHNDRVDPRELDIYVDRLVEINQKIADLDHHVEGVVAAGGVIEFSPADTTARAYPQTDAGSAELFASLYGDRLRYDHRRGRWLLWTGHYWTADCLAAIRGMAIEAARVRYRRAESIPDSKEREVEAKWAIKGESRDKVESLLYFVQAMKPIADPGDDWDRNPDLLGCTNGIVDLKTGILRPGRQEDRITMTTGIAFDADATCPRWLQFLPEVFESNDDLIDWTHRAIGHSATGDTSEQIVCILHGAGCNGKSRFCAAIRYALGDYAHVMPFSTVEEGTRRPIPNDVAALVSRRFVIASETKENRRLNEARIKELTGGDAVTARFLKNEWFTFQPTLKPWLCVNHLPKVQDLSYGFWRRVRLVPFNRQFKGEQAEKHLDDTLKAEAPGILAWIVRGAVEWFKRGLDPVPEAVLAATRQYEKESDELGEYVAERLFIGDTFTAKAGLLFKDYSSWCDERGMKKEDRLNSTAFGRRMGQRFRKDTDRKGTTYHGVGLPADGSNHD
jgi:putative DNA primase/helicase